MLWLPWPTRTKPIKIVYIEIIYSLRWFVYWDSQNNCLTEFCLFSFDVSVLFASVWIKNHWNPRQNFFHSGISMSPNILIQNAVFEYNAVEYLIKIMESTPHTDVKVSRDNRYLYRLMDFLHLIIGRMLFNFVENRIESSRKSREIKSSVEC